MTYSMNDFVMRINQECSSFIDKPITPRVVRYLISEHILDKPLGTTSSARYDEHHCKQIHDYYKMKNNGLTVKQISNISRHAEGDISSFELTNGLTLLVDKHLYPEKIDTEQAIEMLKSVISIIKGDIYP